MEFFPSHVNMSIGTDIAMVLFMQQKSKVDRAGYNYILYIHMHTLMCLE